MRTNRGYLFRAFYSKGVSYNRLHWAETQVQVENQMLAEKVYREKRKGFRCPELEVVGTGRLEARASRVIGLERLFGFL